MNLSNIKNATYRGYTYSGSATYICITSESTAAYFIAVFETNAGIIIAELLNNEIISIKNLTTANAATFYIDDNTLYFEASKVTINYFSPINLTVDSVTKYPSSAVSLSVEPETLYFAKAVNTNQIKLDTLSVDALYTDAVDSVGKSISADIVNVGNWKISKQNNESNKIYLDLKE